MPIEQKHYDTRGRYTGKSVIKTQDEINKENEEFASLIGGVGKLVIAGVAIAIVYAAIMWTVDLLSNPARLSFPHNIFAYYYHYFFKIIGFILLVFKPIVILIYKIPFEYLAFIKGLTRFENLNLILWLLTVIIYFGLLLWAVFILYTVAASIGSDAWGQIGIWAALLTFVPVIIWIGYFILERIVIWLFR